MKTKSSIILLMAIVAILGISSCRARVVVVDREHPRHWHHEGHEEHEHEEHEHH